MLHRTGESDGSGGRSDRASSGPTGPDRVAQTVSSIGAPLAAFWTDSQPLRAAALVS